MAFLNAMNAAKLVGGMSPNPATQGLGEVPKMAGLPPPPTGIGKMPVGAPGNTKKVAGADAISALRNFIGFAPELANDINGIIDKIKQVAYDKPNENQGPAIGDAGPMGAAQSGASPLMDSGGPGPM